MYMGYDLYPTILVLSSAKYVFVISLKIIELLKHIFFYLNYTKESDW